MGANRKTKKKKGSLDEASFRAVDPLAVDEKASGHRDLALEGGGVELVVEDLRHGGGGGCRGVKERRRWVNGKVWAEAGAI